MQPVPEAMLRSIFHNLLAFSYFWKDGHEQPHPIGLRQGLFMKPWLSLLSDPLKCLDTGKYCPA